jgi:hypothetical protein
VHGVGERRPVRPAGQVGLDRLQLRVAGVQHRSVVRIGRGQGGLLEALHQQPALVGQRPGVAAPPGPAVTQQQLAQPMPGPGAVLDHVSTGPAQVPDRFFLHAGDADRHQFPARYSRASRRQSRLSVLTLSPGALGISDGAITSQPTPMLCSSLASS